MPTPTDNEFRQFLFANTTTRLLRLALKDRHEECMRSSIRSIISTLREKRSLGIKE